jgi:hypothetical protein
MWLKIVRFFHDSEIIFYGRIQVFAGALALVVQVGFEVVSHTDLSVFIANPKVLAGVTMGNGFLVEYLRRRRATDLGPPKDKLSTE